MLILPDSSCWIEFFRPHGDLQIQQAVRVWLSADQVALCGPVRAEVLRGARKNEIARVRTAFGALHYLETVDDDWATIADKARELSDKGQNVPLMDVLVSVVAVRNNATVAHKDGHFEAIATVMAVTTHSFL